MTTCANCGAVNPDRAKFCLECGSPLDAPEKSEVRKVVTLVFTDLAGSTAMGEALDPEITRGLMATYFERMQEVIVHHGGTVEKFIGDAVMAVFGIPVLHEDDALRGVRAASAMRTALKELNDDLRERYGVAIQIRTGVNTGEVVAGDPSTGQNLVTGDAVNLAARLEQAAPPGEILLGEQTYELVSAAVEVEPVEPLSLKGKSEPVPAYRLLSVASMGEGFNRRLDSTLVGRDEELRVLRNTLDAVEVERRSHLFTVFGSAGAGKSRLVAEFTAGMTERCEILSGRCLAYGEGITFWPIAEMVRSAASIAEDEPTPQAVERIAALIDADDREVVAQRVASIIGMSEEPTSSEEGFWAVRRLWEAMGRHRPLIAIIDDIHWAEPTLLDLIEYVTGWSTDASILVLCTAREEVLERRPSLGIPKPNSTSVLLTPLSADQSRQLVSQLLDDAAIAERAAARIVEAAEGNPLYVEEMLRMMVDDGLLRKEEGRWVAVGDLEQVEVPATINALISARLDRLEVEERAVVQRGSVAGRTFWWGAVSELSPVRDRPNVTASLQTLVRKELIRPERSTLPGEDAFKFGHILVRDAAYQGLPKDQRVELHSKLHDWLVAKLGDVRGHEEILGYHLEQAAIFKRQLGTPDPALSELERRASEHLDAAGRRARIRSDLPGALNLMVRAAGLVPDDDARKGAVLLEVADIQVELGEFSTAAGTLAAIRSLAEGSSDPLLRAHAEIVRGSLTTHVDADVDAAREIATSAIEVFQAFDDRRGLARAHQLLAESYWVELKYSAVEDNLTRAIEHATAAEDERLAAAARRWLVSSLFYGPTPASEALVLCEEIEGAAGGDQLLIAFSLRAQGGLQALLGRFDEARHLIGRAIAVLQELGVAYSLASSRMVAGTVHHLAGDLAAAEEEYAASFEALDDLGDRSYLATIAGELARVLVDAGRLEEAESFATRCRDLTSDDDLISEGLWRGSLARISAARSDGAQAQLLAREAVALVESTDDTRGHADALMDLAEVLGVTGDRDGARSSYEAALDLYRAKDVVPGIERVTALLDTVD